ncbi:hypothetical protein [Bacillus sp. B15-48]|uniref:hypothetical protein n=1 Tax=Bacillus sp. B15-48 TaxID=1548601 RepID=UPI00193F06F8|nr:hypothetical protein [Bacillus sp. B15-48]MBM4763447.1 hypothetical protein [Bacillus sp. B15-48]
MAFGINRAELIRWKEGVARGEISFLTHYWVDERFPEYNTVTKVGCKDLAKLIAWGEKYGLQPEWIDKRKADMPHFDLLGTRRDEILRKEGLTHLIW